MTWSIVARDPDSRAFGVAIASRFLAVGALCPFIRSGVGALCTQALGHPPHGPAALDLMASGVPAPVALARLLDGDPERDSRQVHILDRAGRNAAHTGGACVGWYGDRVAHGVSVAGNMLAGEAVVRDTLDAYHDHAGLPFAERLLRALEAGQAAGGDMRGQQAAALRLHGAEPYPALDLRVDDSGTAVAELRRIYEAARADHLPYLRRVVDAAEADALYGPG